MTITERIHQTRAKRRALAARNDRLRQLNATPAGRAILSYERGLAVHTDTVVALLSDMAVSAVESLTLPPDPMFPLGSRWQLHNTMLASSASRTTSGHLAPGGLGASWSRTEPTGPDRYVHTFRRVPSASPQKSGCSPWPPTETP